MPAPIAKRFRADSRLTRLVRPFVNRFVPEGETVVSVRSGPGEGLLLPIKLKSEKFYWTGAHEQHVQETLARELEPGMTFWDVGAHIGFISTMAARMVGDTGRVASFEPMPETAPRLRRAVELNELDNVTVLELAVAETSGERMLRPPRLRDGTVEDAEAAQPSLMWTLVDDLGDETGVVVQCRTLDDVAADLGTPDLVKIDAEGAEVEVLAGGMGILADDSTKVIIEISDEPTLSRARALLPQRDFELLGANHYLLR